MPVFEKNNTSLAPRQAIAAIRQLKKGLINEAELNKYASYASEAADAVTFVSEAAAYAAAYAAVYAADATAVVAYAILSAGANTFELDVVKQQIKKLFIQHFLEHTDEINTK